MANEFVVRKGLIVTGSARITGSLEASSYISASAISGAFHGDGSGLTGVTTTIEDVTTYSQTFTSQTSITVNHDLSTSNPIVQVYDNNDEQVIPSKIKINSSSQILIEFPTPTSGKVVVAKGGHLISVADITYAAYPFTSMSSITVSHDLNTITPIVQVYNTDNEQVIPSKIQVLGSGSILVEFPVTSSGRIAISKGGPVATISSFSGSFTGSLSGEIASASYAATASLLLGSVESSSYSSTSEWSGLIGTPSGIVSASTQFTDSTAPFTGSFSGSFYGDGSNLSGVTSYTDSDTLDYINSLGVFSGSFNDVSNNPFTSASGVISASGDLVPTVNESYDLGSPTLRWKDLYLSGSTVYLGQTKLTRNATGDLEVRDSQTDSLKKIRVDELELGTGDAARRIKVENGTVKFVDRSDTDKTLNALGFEGLVTSSAQLSFDEIPGVPGGLVSASSQVNLTEVSNFVSGIKARLNVEGVFTGSAQLIERGFIRTNYTASTDARLNAIENITGSLATDNELSSVSSSFNTRVTTVENSVGTLETKAGLLESATSSLDSRLDSVESITSSLDTRVTDLESYSSSLNTAISLSGADVTLLGNLTVQGTQSIINSQTLVVEDNIIELNGSGATFGGILVSDVTLPDTISGSLLWDSNNNYWIAGQSGSEERVLLTTDKTQLQGLIDNLEVASASLNSFTSSIDTTIKTKLNSEGVVSASSQVNADSITNFDTNVKDKLNADGVYSSSAQLPVSAYTNGTDNRVLTSTGTSGINGESNLTFDGSTLALTGDLNVGSGDLFVDDSAGRVGIGTVSPNNKLDVHGTAAIARLNSTSTSTTSYLTFSNSETNASFIGIENSTGGGLFGSNDAYGMSLGTTGAAGLNFATNNSVRMRIDSSGNVGIANTSPSSYNAGSDDLVIGDGSGNRGLSIISGNGSLGLLTFHDAAGTTRTGGLEYDHSGDSLRFRAANAERMRIDSSGQVGIGVTPRPWDSTAFKALQIGAGASVSASPTAVARARISANAYYDVTDDRFEYIGTGAATDYLQNDGAHLFYTAGSGTADAAISFSERMRIDSSGRVGIGTSSPTSKLHLFDSAAGLGIQIESTATSGEPSLTLFGKNSSGTVRSFSLKYDNSDIIRLGTASPIDMRFETNDQERMRITSAGNVGIGTNSPTNMLSIKGTSGSSKGLDIYHSNGNIVAQLVHNGTGDEGVLSLYDSNSQTVKIAGETNVSSYINSGNVGIGTTSPGGQLELSRASGTSQMLLVRNFATSATGNFTGNYVAEIRAAYTDGATGGALLVHTQEADNSRPTMAVSDSNGVFTTFVNGKVGIGTTNPSTSLHVVNSGAALFKLESTSNNYPEIIYENSSRSFSAGLRPELSNAWSIRDRTASAVRFSIDNNGHILPGANGTQNLGSSSLRWNTVYTSDLSLKNDVGDWTIVEGEDDLFLYNNKRNKVYKFALTEVDPETAPPKRS